MNKSDITVTIIIVIVAFLMMFFLYQKEDASKAIIYYEDKIVKTVDLNSKEQFIVKGYNGDVKIVVENGKIKVDQENSPYNLCSKQGFISKSYETIVCLPNKIVVKIVADNDIDTVIR